VTTGSQLRASDAVLWAIERDPRLRSTIVAIGLFDRVPDRAAVERSLERASRVFPRLRQRISPSPLGVGPPHWLTDEHIDLGFHLRWGRVPGTGSLDDILACARPIAMAEFDHARPLWEFHVLTGTATATGGTPGAAFVLKFHHSITDGVGAVRLAAALFDFEREPAQPEVSPAPPPDRTDSLHRAYAALADQLRQFGSLAAHVPARATAATTDAVRHPVRSTTDAVRLAEAAAKLVAPAGPPCSPLMTGRSLDLDLFTVEVAVDDLRAAAAAIGGTLNDVFVAAVVGGVARYHDHHGVALRQLRVNIPVNIRTGDDDAGGNRFVPARTTVPADAADAADRVLKLGAVVHALRDDPNLGVSDALAAVLAELPARATTAALRSMLLGVDVVLTNIPGSPVPLYLGGAAVDRMYAFAPLAGAAVNVALLSYRGTCAITAEVDKAAVPDLDVFYDCIREGLDDVLALRGSTTQKRPAIAVSARPLTHRRLSALDGAFLAGETSTVPLHVGALAVYDGAPLLDEGGRLRLDDIRRSIDARLDELPQLRWRVAPGALGLARPVWIDDDHFDIEHHVRATTLPAPGTDTQLRELFAELQMQRLGRDRPLWEFWFVEGLAGGRVACVEKMHHALVDGVGGAGAMAVLLSTEPSEVPASRDVPGFTPHAAPSWPSQLADSAREGLVVNPTRWLRTLPSLPSRSAAFGRAVRGLPLASHTSLKGRVGAGRRYATVRLSLDELRTAGRRHDATVNDVLIAIVTGGLRDLLAARGEPHDRLWALMPHNERASGQEHDVGNRVTALYVPLPVGEPDAARRLMLVSAATTRIKASPLGADNAALFARADLWPAPLAAMAGRLIHVQPFVNVVVTNVPGPPMPLYTLGARLLELSPFVPLGGNLTVGIAAMSYDGVLAIGITADRELCPDLDVLVAGIQRDAEDLLARR
jgi:WS/DGAT/MGAT family acyltransferase